MGILRRLFGELKAPERWRSACRWVPGSGRYRPVAHEPWSAGALFVLLRLPDDAPRPVDGDVLRAVRTLSVAPMALAIPLPRPVVASYLRGIGLIVEDRGRDLIGPNAGGKSVAVAFDRRGRIKAVTSKLRPA